MIPTLPSECATVRGTLQRTITSFRSVKSTVTATARSMMCVPYNQRGVAYDCSWRTVKVYRLSRTRVPGRKHEPTYTLHERPCCRRGSPLLHWSLLGSILDCEIYYPIKEKNLASVRQGLINFCSHWRHREKVVLCVFRTEGPAFPILTPVNVTNAEFRRVERVRLAS